jgi:hypothetical protein
MREGGESEHVAAHKKVGASRMAVATCRTCKPRRRLTGRPAVLGDTGGGRHSASEVVLGYFQPSFSIFFFISFIYRILYKILSSISHLSPTTFSKSRSLYIKPYIRNVFYSKFLYVRIYHTSNVMDIFYFYLIQCLKRKEKIEKRRENLYI